MTTPTLPQMPGIPGIPITNNLIPAPGGGGIAQAPETYNWAQWLQESNISEQIVPAADYDAQVVAAEPDKAGNGKLMFKITFQLINGPYSSKKFSRNMVVSNDSRKAMRVFFRQMSCIGCDDQFWLSQPSEAAICERVMNRMCRIQLKTREFPLGSGLIDNEVGFIREAITGGMPGQAPTMINQGPPPMPQFAQQPYQQQPMQAAPISPYAQQVPPQPPQPAQQPPQVPPMQQWGGGQQQPPQVPQNVAPQFPPAQTVPVGTEYAQAPQQAAPPPPPQTPPFEQMLRAPQEAAQPAQQLQPPPSPYQQPAQAAQAVEATPADAQPQPMQLPPDQLAAFQAFMAGQAQQAQPPAQQPAAPPIPRDF